MARLKGAHPVAPGWQISENSGSVGSLRGHLFLPSGPGVVLGQLGGPSSAGPWLCALTTALHAKSEESRSTPAARSDGMLQYVRACVQVCEEVAEGELGIVCCSRGRGNEGFRRGLAAPQRHRGTNGFRKSIRRILALSPQNTSSYVH